VSGFLYNLGRQLGHKAVPMIRKSKWIWNGLAGTDEEALRAETALGNTLAAELRAFAGPVNDPSLAALLNDLCQRLSACVRDKARTFRCELMQDNSPNALALPGGFIFVSEPLAELCERQPDELAFVIGHEMAHVIRRHVWERMLNETTLCVASAVTARAGPLGGWLRQQGMGLLRSAYSGDSEFEADELGLRLMAAAGFSPAGAITFLQRIQRLGSNPADLGQYFASHPPPSERLAKLAPIVRLLPLP
jgi:predicted Zn-dependent protease